MIDILKTFWFEYYNVPTNWYSFWIPFAMWSGCWLHSVRKGKKDFPKWWQLHTLHHLGAITLASASLYIDDDSIFNERNGILFSMSYFIVDIIDSIYMGHILYVAHGTACVVLGYANYNMSLLRALKMNSKASYIESSSVVLVQVKRYRKPWLFAIFALVYTLCRIVWIPCMAKTLLDNGMERTHPVMMIMGLFYCLNIHWYIKIIKIAINGDGKKETKKD